MNKVKIGVFGAFRGMLLINSLLNNEEAEIVAICDKSEIMLGRCKKLAAEKKLNTVLYSDFDEFFKHDMDAVILANYATQHAPYAEKFLRSGRAVLSEVLPVATVAEAVSLVEAVEETGILYAYSENYCFLPAVREIKKKIDSGEIGDIIHAEGEYISNIAGAWPQITYGDKNHWRNKMSSTFYCTHSLGPIVHLAHLRPKTVVGFESINTKFLSDVGYGGGAIGTIMCEMDNGATVKAIQGFPRHGFAAIYWNFYGTNGEVESDRWRIAENIYSYSEDSGKGLEKIDADLEGKLSVDTYANDLVVSNFIKAVKGEEAEIIDVYEACDMALPGILAYMSIVNGHNPIPMPDLRNPVDRELWRNNTFSTDPSVAGEEAAPLCSHPTEPIPDEVYARVKKTADEILKNL